MNIFNTIAANICLGEDVYVIKYFLFYFAFYCCSNCNLCFAIFCCYKPKIKNNVFDLQVRKMAKAVRRCEETVIESSKKAIKSVTPA